MIKQRHYIQTWHVFVLQELRRGKDSLAGKENDVLDRRRDITALPETDPADAEAYSGQEMKRAYYEAFWRAKCVKFYRIQVQSNTVKIFLDPAGTAWTVLSYLFPSQVQYQIPTSRLPRKSKLFM